MKNAIYSSLLVVLLAASGTAMADESMHGMDHAGMQSMDAGQTMQWTDGVVKNVNQKRGKVTLQHGAIENVMPAMTMGYKVQEKAALKSLKAGDKVNFVLEKKDNAYIVTHIKPAR